MTTPNITRSRDSARSSAMFRGQRKVLAIISTSCLLIFVIVKNELYGRKSYPAPGSFTSTCTSIESKLQRTNIHDMIECVILPRVLPTGEWFSNIEPLTMPDFTLLSAWLKTESPSAMDAPKDIPEMYMDDFSMGGMAKIDEKPWYFNQAYLGKTALSSMWTNKTVLVEMDKASRRENFKYGDDTKKFMTESPSIIHISRERWNRDWKRRSVARGNSASLWRGQTPDSGIWQDNQ